MEKKRKKRGNSRALGILVIAILAVAAVFLIRFAAGRSRGVSGGASGGSGGNGAVNAVDASEVLHLTFPALYTPESGEGAGKALTVKEFRRILEDLYARGYVLVNFYDLMEVTEAGIVRRMVEVPEGKKPLVISQSDMRYGEGGDGYPVSLQFSAGSGIANEFRRKDKTAVIGIYDLVPVVEEFLTLHADFSYNGARGLLALSGEGGCFGFQDLSDERFTALVTELRSRGWHFASAGYSGISYASDVGLVREDAEQWQQSIGQHLGTTDVLIFPGNSDIGRWSGYTEDNEKYMLLTELGFRYYGICDDENRTWMQTGRDYLRQVVHRIGSYADYEALMQSGEE